MAACSARKITLRMFSDMQSKHQKALAVCKTALDFIQDDFTDEDTLQWSCICAVCGMCDVCGLCDIYILHELDFDVHMAMDLYVLHCK